MVEIPLYRQQLRQAPAADTRLGIRTNPDAQGAAIGEGVQALGRAAAAVSGAYDRIQTDADNVAALAAKNQLDTAVSPHLAAAQQTRGKDAVGAVNTVLPAYDTEADKIEQNLANDRQRAAFRTYRANRRADIQQSLNAHAAAGMREYDDQQFSANGDLYRQRVGDHVGDAELVNAAVWDRLSEVRGYAQRNGLPEEWVAAKSREETSTAHALVIGGLLDADNTVAAKKWFDTYQEELDPKTRSILTKALEVGTVKTEGQMRAAAIYNPDKTLEAMYAEADQIPDQKVQEEVKRRLDERDSLRTRAIQQIQDKAFTAAYQKVKDDPRGFDALTPTERTAMGPHREETLKQWTLRRSKGQPLPWEQSRAVRYQLEQTASNPATREAFSKANLLDYIDKMNEDDFKALANLQRDVRAGKTEGITSLASKDDLLNEAMAGMGIDPSPVRTTTRNGDTEVAYNLRAVKFRDAVDRRLDDIRAQNKPVDLEAVRKAVDAERMRWTRELTIPGRAWGTRQMRFADTTAADQQASTVNDIPADFMAKLRAANPGGISDRDAIDDFNAWLEQNARAR